MLKLVLSSAVGMLALPVAYGASRMPEIDVRAIIWNLAILAGIAICFGLLDYAVQNAPFITDPIKSFIHWALVVAACLILIFLILGFLGL